MIRLLWIACILHSEGFSIDQITSKGISVNGIFWTVQELDTFYFYDNKLNKEARK